MYPNFAPDKKLRIRINLDRPAPQLDTASPRPDQKKIEIKVGTDTLSFPYWKTKWTNKKTRRVYVSYRFGYTLGNVSRREKRASFKKLRERAQEIAIAKANQETARLQLTPADQASFMRARDLANKITKPLEIVAGDYTQCVEILSGRASVIEACRDYIARHPAGATSQNIPAVVVEFFQKRKMSSKWTRILKKMLERFAARFTGPVTSLVARDFDDWLDGLKDKHGRTIGLRTRRNYFEAILALASFAKFRGYAPNDWNIFGSVSNPDPRKTEVQIYTPRAFASLLNFAESYDAGSKLVPLMTITAFAGVRHGEMNEEKIEHLDWKNVRFRTERIIIGSSEAKTNRKRVIDMPKNLVAWLKPYARPSGRICSLKNTSNALWKLKKKAVAHLRIEAEKVANSDRRRERLEIADELAGPMKNALRKSFISYRKALTGDIERVAEEAGNSPKVIRDTYLHVDEDMKEEAECWFAIKPTRADVLPLFAWGKTA